MAPHDVTLELVSVSSRAGALSEKKRMPALVGAKGKMVPRDGVGSVVQQNAMQMGLGLVDAAVVQGLGGQLQQF